MSDLRRVLLDTSAELIRAEGLGSLSMREVARRARVSHQAPYHYFPDREAILAALVQEGFASLFAEFQAGTEGAATALDRVRATGSAYIRWALAHPAHYRVMFRPELVKLDRFPEAQAIADTAYRFLLDRVAELVAEGIVPAERGEMLALLLWSTVHGAAALLLEGPLPRRGSTLTAEEAGDALMALLADFVGRPPVKARRRSARGSGPRS